MTGDADTEAFSAAVGQFYDATLDPALWPAAVEAAGRYVEGLSAALAAWDTTYQKLNMDLAWNYDPEVMRVYQERLIHQNKLIPISLRTGAGDVMQGSREWPGDFTASELYRVFNERMGWEECFHVTIERSATGFAGLLVGVGGAERPSDEAAMRRLSLLQPHMRRAVLIGRLLERQRVAAAGLADTLDGIEAGLFLLDRGGRVVHANIAAQAMLELGQAVLRVGDTLALAYRGATAALRAALSAAAESGDAALGSRGVAIPIPAAPSADSPYVAHVLPLNSGARRGARVAYAAVAAVFVRRATLQHAAALEAVAKLHRLTPTEARVLLGVVEVGGVPQVAEAFGLSEATVRTHLKRIFDKTGANRQADLVRLIAEMASPLRQ